ncbi:hypothetical protein HY212_02890 [Candidatus Pacearchaeota archaeon]|nr:hypothetical protein [Candidatus Pacearchaeota archaeon]
MVEWTRRVDEGYREYLIPLVGVRKAEEASCVPSENRYVMEACSAMVALKDEYDVGVALATDGLFLSYIAQQFGFPTLNVRLKRRLNGASWQPIDRVDEESAGGKRVIVFDNDALTGRTLRRASRELSVLSPSKMDLLLIYEQTPITTNMYRNGRTPRGLLSPVENFNKWNRENGREHVATEWHPTPDGGLVLKYLKNGSWEETREFRKGDWVYMHNCRTNVPEEFEKVMTLEKDFKPTPEAVSRLEEVLGIVQNV